MHVDYPAILDRLEKGPPTAMNSVGGGCIADARIAEFEDGSRVFVKRSSQAVDMFEREAEGLSALASAGAIRVPEVLAVEPGALVLECIESAPRCTDFFPSFGRDFARLHRRLGPACGFTHDNYIGATAQLNHPVSGPWPQEQAGIGDGGDWPEFFLERRLRFQARLAQRQGHGADLLEWLERGASRIRHQLEQAIEPPSLLHGDLWSGNYLADENGHACLIDPAAYYGHREADLAMTRLFGGFPPEFYAAYADEWPLQDGYEARQPIYQLYHLLNHLNLFGSGYYAQCKRILARLAL
jgi:fructosamine-3-kinase